eukprot:CAMPEP_0113500004 /NCGR_PEP_ID=MMETSP0014_2-20120614/32066_1 /TAXON_ID=2857 /ORGANISM="Nitzschia sp." /LENGTH=178 /DNA_ID=CAMNT_0000394249 /DNA_START=225 /DNA_END=761 /DNA_ORIENTATION=+ /assembly_acc=CAM_ASM_000159
MSTAATTSVVAAASASRNLPPSRPKLRVRIKRYHAVAKWTWNVAGYKPGSTDTNNNNNNLLTDVDVDDEEDDDVCGICQSAFEGTPPGVKYPGDEAPVVFGVCGHAFHLQCVATWLNASRNTCPICRAEWDYGNNNGGRGGGGDDGGNGSGDSSNNNNNNGDGPGLDDDDDDDGTMET